MMPRGLFFCIYAIIRLAFGDAYPQKQHVSEQNEEWSKTLLSSFFDHLSTIVIASRRRAANQPQPPSSPPYDHSQPRTLQPPQESCRAPTQY